MNWLFDLPLLLKIEFVLILAIVVWQIGSLSKILKHINIFRSFFGNDDATVTIKSVKNPDGSEIELPLLEAKNSSDFFENIKNRINYYIKENFNTGVSFEVIQNLINREVKVKDEEINHFISFPVYLGLIGTLLGVFFGIWSLLVQLDLSDGLNFAEVNLHHFLIAILGGVSASIVGLAFGTILTTFFYKSALKEVLEGKNNLLFHLKVYLIPQLIEVDHEGIGGLRISLEKFSHEAKTMSKNLVDASSTNSKNLEHQIRLMNHFEKLDITQISIENIKIFEKLENNLQAFNNFSMHLENMERISKNLESFASRTVNIDNIIKQVTLNIKQSNEVIQFIEAHKNEIERYKDSSMEFIGKVTKEIAESLEKMKSNTEELMEEYHKSVALNGKSIAESTEEMKSKTEKMMESLTGGLSQIAKNALKNYPELFEDLRSINHLERLPEIKDETTALKIKLHDTLTSSSTKIDDLKQTIHSFLSKMERSNTITSESIKRIDSKLNETSRKIETDVTKLSSEVKGVENQLKSQLRGQKNPSQDLKQTTNRKKKRRFRFFKV